MRRWQGLRRGLFCGEVSGEVSEEVSEEGNKRGKGRGRAGDGRKIIMGNRWEEETKERGRKEGESQTCKSR